MAPRKSSSKRTFAPRRGTRPELAVVTPRHVADHESTGIKNYGDDRTAALGEISHYPLSINPKASVLDLACGTKCRVRRLERVLADMSSSESLDKDAARELLDSLHGYVQEIAALADATVVRLQEEANHAEA